MKTRAKKNVAIILCLIMIFTMNTFVFGNEINNEKLASEKSFEDLDITKKGEDAELSYENSWNPYNDFASHKFDATGGWYMPDSIQQKYKDGTIELSDGQYADWLCGCTESCDLRIKVSGNNSGIGNKFEVYASSMVMGNTFTSKALTVTLASNNDADYGYSYLGYYDFDKAEHINVNCDADVEVWAAYVSQEGVKYNLDFSKKNECIICTFSNDEEKMKERNMIYENVTKYFNGGSLSYNSMVPYVKYMHICQSKSGLNELNMILSDDNAQLGPNGEKYSDARITKYKWQHKKEWGNKAKLIVKKISGCDKNKAKALKQAINNANIEITIYPYNMSIGSTGDGYNNIELKKFKKNSNGKHMLKLRAGIGDKGKWEWKKTYSLKNKKPDNWGGKIELTLSGNGVVVSGSNMFIGFIEP